MTGKQAKENIKGGKNKGKKKTHKNNLRTLRSGKGLGTYISLYYLFKYIYQSLTILGHGQC